MQIVKRPEIILTEEEKETLKKANRVFTGIAEWIDDELLDDINIGGEAYDFDFFNNVIDFVWRLVEN